MNVTPTRIICVVSVFAIVDRVEFYHVSWVPASEKTKIIIRYIHIRYTRFLAEF